MQSQNKFNREFSFELFPARTPEAATKLETTVTTLAQLQPDYFSVTFGAGGSTREATFEAVKSIRKKITIEVVPHISCIGLTKKDVIDILSLYRTTGIKRLVILRGDMPSGYSISQGDFLHANELVDFVHKETNNEFHIAVAAYPDFHPQSVTTRDDLENFKRKVDAGANSAITQYFYNPDAYFRFVDSCEKLAIDIPIVPGVMPITNCTQLLRFSETCGADIPSWILKRLLDFGDDRVAICEFGIDVVTELCRNLLAGGAPGIHIFTMNKYVASQTIWENLKL